MAYGSIPSHIPKLRNSWIISAAPWSGRWHRASTRLLPPTWGPPVQWLLPYLRTASAVLSEEIVFAPGPRITLSHISPCSATARNMKTWFTAADSDQAGTKLGLATQMWTGTRIFLQLQPHHRRFYNPFAPKGWFSWAQWGLFWISPTSSSFVIFFSYHWLFNVATSFVNGPCTFSVVEFCSLGIGVNS